MRALRRLGVHLAVIGSYLVIALVALRPLGGQLTRTLPRAEQHDVLLHGWILAWTARQLLRAPWDLFDANVFFPYQQSLAYTEHLLPEALPVAPLYAITDDPVLAYNVAYLLVFVLGGWGTFLLLRRLTGDPWAAWVGGTFACWFPARRWNLAHINTLAVHGVPFALLALHRLLERPGVGTAVLAGVTVALASLTSAYYTIYLPLILLVVVPLMARAGGHLRDPKRIAAVGLAAATALALATTILLPYLQAWGGEAQPWELQVAGAVDVGEFLVLDSLLWHDWLVPDDLDPLTSPFFPGLVATGLALVAAFGPDRTDRASGSGPRSSGVRRAASVFGHGLAAATLVATLGHLVAHHRATLAGGEPAEAPWTVLVLACSLALGLLIFGEGRRFPVLGRAAVRHWRGAPAVVRVWFVAFGVAVLLALGPRLKFFGYAGPPLPYELVWRYLPGAGALRAPFRAAILGQAFLALLVGHGASRLLARLRPRIGFRGAAVLALALGTLMFGESVGRALPLVPLPRPGSRVHAWLADRPGDFGVLDWPIPDTLDQSAEGQWLSTRHWKRRVTGHNGRLPDDIHRLFELSYEPMSTDFWETLVRRFPVRYVVVHLHVFDTETRAWLLREGLPGLSRWLQLVEDFGADRVYRLRNGGPAGQLERRLASWMLPGTLRVHWARPQAGAAATPQRFRVSLDDTTVAEGTVVAGQPLTEVALPTTRRRSPPWLRLEVETPVGAELRVERLEILAADGVVYP